MLNEYDLPALNCGTHIPAARDGGHRMRMWSIALGLLAAIAGAASAASAPVRVVSSQMGIGLTVEQDGSFRLTTRTPAWTFAGKVGSSLSNLASRSCQDLAGRYREAEFKYATSRRAAAAGAIRLHEH